MKQNELIDRVIGQAQSKDDITNQIIKLAVQEAESGLSIQAQAKKLDRQIDHLLKEDRV